MHKHPEAFTHVPQDKKWKTTEHVKTAEQLAKQHGKVPGSRWLVAHGYNGLYRAIGPHPEAFAHLPQDSKCKRRGRTLGEYLALAEQLAKEQSKLPGPGWLVTHGYFGLYQAMHKHPEAFVHIPQDRRIKTLAEHVKTAEQLAKRHEKLPNPQWLQVHGNYGLYCAMLKTP